MRSLLVVNCLMLAASLVMATVLGVVCLMYWANIETTPRLAADLPGLLAMSGVFAVVSVIGGAAAWSLKNRTRLMWPAQGLFLTSLILVLMYLREFLI